HAADIDYIRLIRGATTLPVLVGSGVTPENVGGMLSVVDGVIVGSALKTEGVWWNPVDRKKAGEFAVRARQAGT
ncbi:MAG: tryptophan synthase subunit alpha, partial [Bauldia sp.]|nr:tryptophan synthase subunit alpha [Bauldia sp.]